MFRPLRRKKRAITDEKARELLATCKRGVFAVNGDDGFRVASNIFALLMLAALAMPFPSTTSLTPSTTRFISMAPRLATRSIHSSMMIKSALPFTATSGTRTATGLPTL